ncbi:hypothetical protein GCK72_007702 [Caenorhabditis remanei]|uniref:Uncharacterized protein n=1 Tax=Caenorhabditis remanei TaxID=31234 RepID=A0A6A5HN08_CAERE|nr:hypothetical protein GCK72_007702 [Caenorhabditis remanei]KAF1767743.1 hypothetical protein GCK72_007702 [Caenorhabditis remanei]
MSDSSTTSTAESDVIDQENINRDPIFYEPSRLQSTSILAENNQISTLACKVCGDKPRGVHYGVLACEGCRSFFRTNRDKKEELKCRKSNKCVVDKYSRNKCGKCRMEKCLKLGMDYNLRRPANGGFGKGRKLVIKKIQRAHDCCRVCGDISFEHFFDIVACEGCKGFFRTHHEKDIKLECRVDGNCDINIISRNTCKSCRMKKCLEAGMGLKHKVFSKSEFTEIVNKVGRSFGQSCTYKDTDIESVEKSNFELTRFDDPLINRINAWQVYAPIIDFENHQTGLFVNHLPFIKTFEINDKVILFKRSSFLMFVLRNITKFSSDGFMLPSKLNSKIKIPYETLKIVYGDLLINEIISIASKLESMDLSHHELSLFTALVFFLPFTADAPERTRNKEKFKSHKTLELVYHCYKTFLNRMFSKYENGHDTISELDEMTFKLEDLNKLHRDNTISFLQVNSKFMKIPLFLCEVYEIPKPKSLSLSQLLESTNADCD